MFFRLVSQPIALEDGAMARFLLLLPLGATAIGTSPLRCLSCIARARGPWLSGFQSTTSGIDELSQWLASAMGLDYARDDALRVAQVEAPILTQCAVTLAARKPTKRAGA